MSAATDVSLVLATYNGAAHVARTIAAIRGLRREALLFELLVLDDGSTDDTRAVVRASVHGAAFPVRFVDLPVNGGKAHALNCGIACATGALLAFLDDDIEPDAEWLVAHAAVHATAVVPVACVGPVRYPAEWVRRSNLVRYRAGQCAATTGSVADAPHVAGIECFAGGNLSIRKEVLLQAGGFNEALRRAEDRELAIRLHQRGVPLWFAPQAGVIHYEQEMLSYAGLAAKYQAYYRGDAQRIEGLHPKDWDLAGRWCLQPVRATDDAWARRVVKRAVRWLGQPWLGRRLFALLERMDGWHWLYSRRLYQYAFLCLALEARRCNDGFSNTRLPTRAAP